MAREQRKGTFSLALEGFPEETTTELRNEERGIHELDPEKRPYAASQAPHSIAWAEVLCPGQGSVCRDGRLCSRVVGVVQAAAWRRDRGQAMQELPGHKDCRPHPQSNKELPRIQTQHMGWFNLCYLTIIPAAVRWMDIGLHGERSGEMAS